MVVLVFFKCFLCLIDSIVSINTAVVLTNKLNLGWLCKRLKRKVVPKPEAPPEFEPNHVLIQSRDTQKPFP